MTSFKQKLRDLLNNPLSYNHHDLNTESNFNKSILETRRRIKRDNLIVRTQRNKSVDSLSNLPKTKYDHHNSLKTGQLLNFINSTRKNKLDDFFSNDNNNNNINLRKLFSSELQKKINSVLKKEMNKPIKLISDDLNIFNKESLSPKSKFLINNIYNSHKNKNKNNLIKYDDFFCDKTSRFRSLNKNQSFKISFVDKKRYSYKKRKNYFDF